MKMSLLFSAFLTMLWSCDEPKAEKRVYTEKDIEGYWAVYTTLHPNVLADALANPNDSICMPLLRFYNAINGSTDSTFFVKGDSIYVISYEGYGKNMPTNFELVYRIRFASIDRLELWELSTGQFITYYSLLTLPVQHNRLEKFELNPICDEGFAWTRDSLVSTFHLDCSIGCYFGVRPEIRISSDSVSFERVNQLYRRVDLRTVMLESQTKNIDPPPPGGIMIGVTSSERSDYIPITRVNLDPCLLAIRMEAAETMKWVYLSSK